MKYKIMALSAISVLFCSCQTVERAAVVAVTGTTIGLEVGQSPADSSPSIKFGYNRAEVAVVSEKELGGGSQNSDVANVVMELRYSSDEDANPGVYQRLAVGKTAVSQVGASLMFAKGPDGKIDKASADALNAALGSTFDPDEFKEEDPDEFEEIEVVEPDEPDEPQ